jgi:hypothetical protein
LLRPSPEKCGSCQQPPGSNHIWKLDIFKEVNIYQGTG